MSEQGEGHSRNLAAGFVPRHAESFAAGGALGADVPTVWKGADAACFRVGVAGDVIVTDSSGVDVTYYSVQIGETIYIQFSKIESTGTTAQKITVGWL